MTTHRGPLLLWSILGCLLVAGGIFAAQRWLESPASFSAPQPIPSSADTSPSAELRPRLADVPPTIWPLDIKQDALEACDSPAAGLRDDPIRTAEAFGSDVLGWNDAVGWVKKRTRYGTAVSLYEWAGHEAPPAPRVHVWIVRVAPQCWAVGSVSRPSDTRRPGLSLSIRGRRVQVFFSLRGAASATVEVGYGGKLTRKETSDSLMFDLGFKPRTTGHLLILLRDEFGHIKSAIGTPLPAGDFAAG